MNKYDQNKNFTRVNFQIRCQTVRLIKEGEQLGIMPTEKARKIAQDMEMDLVEIAPHANPPVCHIMKYDEFLYKQKLKEKENKKKQKESLIETKEIRFRPGIQEHDIETKINAIKRFLEDGSKVQLMLQFKNREIAHKDEGFKVINKVLASLHEVAMVELAPKLDGPRLLCRLAPRHYNDS